MPKCDTEIQISGQYDLSALEKKGNNPSALATGALA